MSGVRLTVVGPPDRDVLGEGGDPVPVFRALSDPLRCRLLAHLCRRGETSRAELEAALGATKTMLTYHIRTLAQAGLVDVHGSARALTYSVRRETFEELQRWLADPRSAAPTGRDGVACARR
ncbi:MULTISPECIES: ArsR/SmtB family transcription factor [unclassified Blastococcus]